MTAVGAVVPVIPHDEVVPLWNHLRPPIFVAAVLAGDVIVANRYVVDVYLAVHDAHRISFFTDDPLDERLVRVEGVEEHHDVASTGFADAVNEFVDDEAVLVLEGGRHALALDSRDLESESDDEDRVDGSRGQGLDPGHQFFLDALEAQPRRRRAVRRGSRQRRLDEDLVMPLDSRGRSLAFVRCRRAFRRD